ncbi:hypothetical protein D3C85_1017370 [compost metagenome]
MFVQLQAIGPSYQGHQQALAFIAQARFQIPLQASFKQPQAKLRHAQPNHHQDNDQSQAQAGLDRFHFTAPQKT